MASVLQRLARIVSAVDPDDLPDDVVHEASRRLLDALGCMLGGSDAGPVRAVYDAVAAPAGAATLVGDPRRAGPADAALANCTALRYLDYMDGHPGPYSCHPSLVIPAVLATAEAAGATGRAVVRAIALGYEIDIRMQLGSGDPDVTAHGWSSSTNLALAVPAAIGGLLALPEERLAHALAISTVHAPTLNASGRGQMAASKACVDGMVAQSAVTAALLAKHGMTGQLSAFDGKDGFVTAVARAVDEEILLAPIERFRILDVYTKQYNAVKCAQSAVGSALHLRAQLRDGWAGIESITLRLAERDWRNQSHDAAARRRPGSRDTANHSLVYCVAAALVDGQLQAEQFAPDRLSDTRIHSLIDRIRIEPDATLTPYWPAANPVSVEIRTRSGQLLQDTTIHFPGHPGNPISDDDLGLKFRSLAAPRLGEERAAAVAAEVRRLPERGDVASLLALVRTAGPAAG